MAMTKQTPLEEGGRQKRGLKEGPGGEGRHMPADTAEAHPQHRAWPARYQKTNEEVQCSALRSPLRNRSL